MGSSKPEAPQLGAALTFLRSIWALDHALHARSKAMAKRSGLTGPQRLALRIISSYPRISSGELSRLMHVHPSTLTGVLQRLEQLGFVARSSDPGDGRRALFSLTPAGEKRAGPMAFSIESAVQDLLKDASRRDVEAAHRVVLRLATLLLEGTVAGQTSSEVMDSPSPTP